MFSNFLNRISQIHLLSADLQESLSQVLVREHLPKRTILLEEGQVANHVYFLESGLARSFYFLDGEEITGWFMQENDFFLSVISYYTRRRSQEWMELLEDSTLISIHYRDLARIYAKYPEFNHVGRILTEQYYVRSEQRIMSIRKLSSRERYNQLLEQHPGIFERVHHKYIASYLGMSAESLSRVRNGKR